MSEVRRYWEEQTAFEAEPQTEELIEREEYLFAHIEQLGDEIGESAEVVIRERVRIARLSPVR